MNVKIQSYLVLVLRNVIKVEKNILIHKQKNTVMVTEKPMACQCHHPLHLPNHIILSHHTAYLKLMVMHYIISSQAIFFKSSCNCPACCQTREVNSSSATVSTASFMSLSKLDNLIVLLCDFSLHFSLNHFYWVTQTTVGW